MFSKFGMFFFAVLYNSSCLLRNCFSLCRYLCVFCSWCVCVVVGQPIYTTCHVNTHTGVNNVACLEGSIPCATLAYALEDLDDNTTVFLDNDVMSHPNITTIQDGPISNFTISSSRGSTLINCSEEGGFVFINVDGLSITNTEFHNCGALRNSTSYNAHGDPLTYTVSLYLYNCTDVSLVSTTVSNSPGAGVVMLAVTGSVEIINSTFIGNGCLICRNVVQSFSLRHGRRYTVHRAAIVCSRNGM